MDPISLTASIISILQLTKALGSYVNDLRNATDEQKKLAVEATNLYGLLTSLRSRVEAAISTDPWFQQVKMLGSKNGPLDQFKNALERIVEILKPALSQTGTSITSTLLWSHRKKEVGETLHQVERLKSIITCALANDLLTLSQAIHGGVEGIERNIEHLTASTQRLQISVDQDLQDKISQWLDLPDPSTNYQDSLKKRHPETGSWFLEGQPFIQWKSAGKCSLMWMHGNAGSGKTILTSAILQDLIQYETRPPTSIAAYFFFDFNDADKQSSKKAVRSLLFQLALQEGNCMRGLEALYWQCKGERQPSEKDVMILLQAAVSNAERTFLVLDALDECRDRESLLTILDELVNVKWNGLRILATSRRERDIVEQLHEIVDYNINLQREMVDKDISVYIRDRLRSDRKLSKWPPNVQEEISSKILQNACGMFRWVYCQLEAVRQCVKLSALRKSLSSLPKTLDETYARILQSLESINQLEDAVQVLNWLCFSIRPLTLSEIIEILAIENGDSGGFFPEERLPDPTDIMTICSSLISLVAHDKDSPNKGLVSQDGEESTTSSTTDTAPTRGNAKEQNETQVRLAHFSVKEYLLSERCPLRSQFEQQSCHTAIAESCLRYLLYVIAQEPWTEEVIERHPLSQYAAKYWWQHARKVDATSDCAALTLASKLLSAGNPALHSWLKLHNIDDGSFQGSRDLMLNKSILAQPLYYAASIGIPEVARRVLEETSDVNAVGGRYKFALNAAAAHGHEKVLRMLISAGAHIDPEADDTDTALQVAASYGHEKIVQILLDAGANPNVGGRFHSSALEAAASMYSAIPSFEARTRIVQIILGAGTSHEVRSAALNSAIHFPEILEILIKHGVNIESTGRYASPALQSAVFYKLESAINILLNNGADANTSGGQWGSVLSNASLTGHALIIQMLLNHGAVLNKEEGDLILASENGHKDAMQVLLRAGADVNQCGGLYNQPLQAAAAFNHESAVSVLLDAGANVDAQGGYFGGALQAACSDSQADISVGGIRSDTSTRLSPEWLSDPTRLTFEDQLSVMVSNFEIKIELRLSFGAKVKPQTSYCGVSLQKAPSVANEAIIIGLLRHAGAKINEKENAYNETSHQLLLEDLVTLILRHRMRDFDRLQDDQYRGREPDSEMHHEYITSMMRSGSGSVISTFHYLTEGYEWIARALLDLGAKIRIPGGEQAPFGENHVSGRTSTKIVRALLEAGTDVNMQGGVHGNALKAAARYSHKDLVQLLLDHGADVHQQEGEYGTALQAACASFSPDLALVHTLLDAGAEVNLQAGVYGSALQAACYRGSTEVVRMLLNAGADVNIQGGVYGQPLQAACASPELKEELVRVLLDAGAKADATGGKLGSAMQALEMKSYRAVVDRPDSNDCKLDSKD